MAAQLVYLFPNPNSAEVSDVGGKGLSLMIASQEGLPVPPGFILSSAFFTPWFSQLKKTKAWNNFLKTEKETLKKVCDVLKNNALQLVFTKDQEQELLQNIHHYEQDALFA